MSSGALGVLPEEISFAQAATLPIAGLTAYHCLRRRGLLLGKSVLVVGATGGVGDFGVRLAALSGARVTAHLRSAKWESIVREAGAHNIAIGESLRDAAKPFGPYDLVLESVGGQTLKDALSMLAREGMVITYGLYGREPLTLEAGHRVLAAGGLYGLSVYHDLANVEAASVGLRRLAELVADGKLKPHIAKETSWREIAVVPQELLDRRYPGKAVLYLD